MIKMMFYRVLTAVLLVTMATNLSISAASEAVVPSVATPVSQDETEGDRQVIPERESDHDEPGEPEASPETSPPLRPSTRNSPSMDSPGLDIFRIQWFGHSVWFEIDGVNKSPAAPPATIEYDPTVISFDETPLPIYFFRDWPDGEEVAIGVAQANNATGIITFSLNEYDTDANWDRFTWLYMPATLQNITCEPGDAYGAGTHSLNFRDNTGFEWNMTVPSGICNGVPASISGTWIAEDTIRWTIDSGSLFNQGVVYWYGPVTAGSYTCDDVEFAPDAGTEVYDPSCYNREMAVGFVNGEGDVTRTRINVDWTVAPESTADSYIACVNAFSNPGAMQTTQSPVNGTEYYECFELFAPEGEDSLTLTASEVELNQGDELTYTINVSTTGTIWNSIYVSDLLPEGFSASKIECDLGLTTSVTSQCELVDGELAEVLVLPEGNEGDSSAGPVDLTISIIGTVTAEPGSVIENQACSIRTMPGGVQAMAIGDPLIPGGGEICESVSVTVLADEPGEPPTPTPIATTTPLPTSTVAPTATVEPGATPSVDPDPTATHGVVGLPETGHSSRSSVSGFFMAGIVVSLVMATALGIRITSSSITNRVDKTDSI